MLRKISFNVYADINNASNFKQQEENPIAVIIDFTAFQNGLSAEYNRTNNYKVKFSKVDDHGAKRNYLKHWTGDLKAPCDALESFIERVTNAYPSSPVYFVVPREASYNERIVIYGVVAQDPVNLIWWTSKREGKGKNGQPTEDDNRPQSNWNDTKARIMNVVSNVKYRVTAQDASNIQGSSKSKTLCDSTDEEDANEMVLGD